MKYYVRGILKEECKQEDGNYLVTFISLDGKKERKKMVIDIRTISFYSDSMEDAINHLDLNELQELHIEKKYTI